jgi:hypothetical protein
MKGAVDKTSPHTLLELKAAIADFIRNIPLIELSRVLANKIRRVDACLQAREDSFQHLLYYKYEKCICIDVQGLSEYNYCLRKCTGTFVSPCINKKDVPPSGTGESSTVIMQRHRNIQTLLKHKRKVLKSNESWKCTVK